MTFDDFTKKYIKEFIDTVKSEAPNVGETLCKMMGYDDVTDPMTLPSEEICRRMFSREMEEYEPFEDWMVDIPTRSEYYEAMFKEILNDNVFDLMGYYEMLNYYVPVLASEAAEEDTPLEYFTKIINDGVEKMYCSEMSTDRECLRIYEDLCNDLERFRNYRQRRGDTTVETYNQYHYTFMVKYVHVQMCMMLIEALYPEYKIQIQQTESAA